MSDIATAGSLYSPQVNELENINIYNASATRIRVKPKKDTRRMSKEKVERIQSSIRSLDEQGPITLDELFHRIDGKLG